MDISVIIPVYNTERYLKKCLDSIVNQINVSIQVILVDDGSTDSSSLICDDYASHYSFVEVIHTKNVGPASAKNRGFAKAIGDFVAFIDSDDEIKLDMFSRMHQSAMHNNADIVCCNYIQIDGNGNISHTECTHKEYVLNQEEGIKHLLIKDKIYSQCWTKIYRRAMLIDNKTLNVENISTDEDFIYNIEAFSHSSIISIVDEPLYIYTHRESSLSKDYYREHISQYIDNRIMRLELVDNIIEESFPSLKEAKTFHCLMYYNELLGKVCLFPEYYADSRIREVFSYIRRNVLTLWKYNDGCGFSKAGIMALILLPISCYLYYRRIHSL